MNNINGKKWISAGIFGAATQVVFWIIYSFSDNIVGSIGITAAVFIIIGCVLFGLDQIKKETGLIENLSINLAIPSHQL